MKSIAVNAIHSGMQSDGHWMGTPSLMVQLMDHPQAHPSGPDGSYLKADWEYDSCNEVPFTKLMARRIGASSPHFCFIGAATLNEIIGSFRERHIVLYCREPGRWDLAPLVVLLRNSGRTVQILTTEMSPGFPLQDAWVSLVVLPTKQPLAEQEPHAHWPSEVLASIRWRGDLDRAESLYSRMGMVWLRPAALAEDGIYRQCIAVATRHLGWRVTPLVR